MSLRTALRFLEQGDWEQAHPIVQADDSALGSWAHGIVHLQEGDVENARYWLRQAGRAFSSDIAAELSALAQAIRDSEARTQ